MDFLNEDDVDTGSEYVPDKEDAEDDSDSNSKSGKITNSTQSNKTWKYFDTNVDNPDLANCKLCKKEVSFNKLSDLKSHVAIFHGKVEVGSMGSSDLEYTEKYKGHISKGWAHFHRSDAENKIATCKYCGKEISYKFIGNLMKHVLRMHSKTQDEKNDGSDSSVNEEVELKSEPQAPLPKKSSRRPKAWKFFDPKDLKKKIAVCKICFKDFSYQASLSNLTKHIKKTHPESLELLGDDEVETVRPKIRKPQKRFQSAVWRYFDMTDNENRTTRCKLCGKRFSFTCTTNLAKHIRRIHCEMMDGSTDEEYEEVFTDDNSPIWAYFKCLDEALKIANCLICKKRVDYNDVDDLKRHMKIKHPKVDFATKKPKKLMITGSGDIYEIDDGVAKQEPVVDEENSNPSDDWLNHNDEVDALHTEYLDEEVSETELIPSPKRLKPTLKCQNQRVSHTSRTNDDATSIDMFGKYLVTLLKKLPKHKSDYLQMEFIKKAMEAENDNNIKKSHFNRKPVKITRPVINSSDQHVKNNSDIVNDDSFVSSNSGVRKIITADGVIQSLVSSNEQVVTSACYGNNSE